MELFRNLWGIFWMLFFFGGSIFIHEFGHFWIAKKRGLRVPKFSIGFGPSLFSWKRGETTYCLALFPLGGYVALPQMGVIPILEGKENDTLQPISFTSKCLVAVMGAVFNILFAFVLACLLWAVGLQTPAQERTRTLGYVLPTYNNVETPAAKAGLKQGDEILAVDGAPIEAFSDIEKRIILSTGHDKNQRPQAEVTYKRNGNIFKAILDLMRVQTNPVTKDEVRFSGIAAPQQELIIEAFEAGSFAEKSGLRKGDRLLQVNDVPLYSIMDLREYLNKKKPQTVTFLVERNGEKMRIACETKTEIQTRGWLRYGNETDYVDGYEDEDGVYLLNTVGDKFSAVPNEGHILTCNGASVQNAQQLSELIKTTTARSIMLEVEAHGLRRIVVLPNDGETVTVHPAETVQRVGIAFAQPMQTVHDSPFGQFKKAIGSTFETLGCLVNRNSDVKMKHLMGAPGIMRVLHRFSIDDFRRLLWFMVILNINLAILNLLPIPVLDGGHILFAVIEKIRRKPLPPKCILGIQNVFVMLFLGLMAYVIFFDLRRWQGDVQSEAAQRRLEKLQVPVHMK